MSEKKPFLLRLDPELWDELQAWAADDLRSVNGQIEWILRRAMQEMRRREAPGKRRPGRLDANPPRV